MTVWLYFKQVILSLLRFLYLSWSVYLSILLVLKVLLLTLDWFPSTTEASWEKKWALMDCQRALESYVEVRNCSSLVVY